MKKLVLALILAFLSIYCLATEYEDVIYCKNGDIIRGMIIENAPNDYVKIKINDSVITVEYANIIKFKKEEIVSQSIPVEDKEPKIDRNGWLIGGGFGNSYGGYGVQVQFNAHRIGYHAGIGYLSLGPAFQLGAKIFFSEKRNFYLDWQAANFGYAHGEYTNSEGQHFETIENLIGVSCLIGGDFYIYSSLAINIALGASVNFSERDKIDSGPVYIASDFGLLYNF
jgi:hypothetical protein